MRKFLKYIAVAAVALTTTAVFTACSDDDDDSTTPTNDNTIAQWKVTSQATISPTLTSAFDYTVFVKLPDGTTEPISGVGTNETNSLTSVLNAANLIYPATVELNVIYKLKAGKTVTADDVYTGTHRLYLSAVGVNSKGATVVSGDVASFSISYTNQSLSRWYNRHPDGDTISNSLTIIKTDTGYTFE